MAFGRDVFDLVFAQAIGPTQIKSPKTQLLKQVHEVQCMPKHPEMIDFSTYELPRQCFF